jgi:hypothetical protein
MAKRAKESPEPVDEGHEQALEIAKLPLRVIRYGRIILHIREGRVRQIEYHETVDID